MAYQVARQVAVAPSHIQPRKVMGSRVPANLRAGSAWGCLLLMANMLTGRASADKVGVVLRCTSCSGRRI